MVVCSCGREGAGMDKPAIVTKAELAHPGSEQTRGMGRGQAFAHEGVWAGYSVFPGGATTGWHHHGDYATYGYITEGTLIVEYADETLEVHAGDFVYIPAHLVHRESVPAEGGEGAVLRVGGEGPTVYNVEGPDGAET
jgi:quercetin dioxygenase-like cupin family protein